MSGESYAPGHELYVPRDYRSHEELENVSQLVEVLSDWEESPPSYDIRISTFSRAVIDLLAESPQFEDVIRKMITARREQGRHIGPINAAYLIKDVFQHFLRQRLDFPVLTLSPEGWKEAMQAVLNERSLEVLEAACSREVQTNIPDRYMGPQLWLALHSNRYPGGIDLLDVGCSVGAGLNGLISGDIGHRITVREPKIERLKPNDPLMLNDPSVNEYYFKVRLSNDAEARQSKLNKHANRLNKKPLRFNQAVGVDLYGLEDLGWAVDCLYPGEIVAGLENRAGVMSELHRLGNLNPPNVTKQQLDFTNLWAVRDYFESAKAPVEKFDVITMITIFNQLKEAQRADCITNAKNLLKDKNSVIIVQDFGTIDPAIPGQVSIYDKWSPYTYRTIVYIWDEYVEAYMPQEFLWWSNGRCREVIISPTATKGTARIQLPNFA